MPFTNRSGPNFRRHFVAAAGCGRDFPILGEGEVREIAKGMNMLRAIPDRSHAIIAERQLRDRASAADNLRDKDAIRRQPKERTDRTLAVFCAIQNVMTIG